MRNNISKQLFSLVVIVILSLGMTSIGYFHKETQMEYSRYLDYRDELLDNLIMNVISTYESFANLSFRTIIDKDEILDILYKANDSDEEELKVLRKHLYSQLKTNYELLAQYNFKQVQIQLANGDSFLRFNSPDKFGDNLLDVRRTIKIVNKLQHYATGFEEGRIFSGYRFVFPLKYHNKYIGSAEISLSPVCVLEELYARNPNRDFGFIQLKKNVNEKVFEGERWRYTASKISDAYVIDNDVLDFIESNEYSKRLYSDEKFIETVKASIDDKLGKEGCFTDTLYYNNKSYLIQFSEVINTSNESVAYFYSISEDSQIKNIFYVNKLIIMFIIAIGVILIYIIIFIMKKQDTISQIALIDQLTKVYNRHFFYELAEKEMSKLNRGEQKISLGIIDIDFFKKVNDTYGHSIGDEVLKELASISKNTFRNSDIFARFGGEEFVIMFPNTSLPNAFITIERLRKNVENYAFDKKQKITVSCGITEISTSENLDAAIERADRALYMAKEGGRNRTVKLESPS